MIYCGTCWAIGPATRNVPVFQGRFRWFKKHRGFLNSRLFFLEIEAADEFSGFAAQISFTVKNHFQEDRRVDARFWAKNR